MESGHSYNYSNLLIPAKCKGSQTLIYFSHPNICLDKISDHEEENMDSDETEKMESPGQYAVIKAMPD